MVVVHDSSPSFSANESKHDSSSSDVQPFSIVQVYDDNDGDTDDVRKSETPRYYTSFVKGSTAVTGVYQGFLPFECRFDGAHGTAGFNAEEKSAIDSCDSPPPPTDPEEIRKLMRAKMHRCKLCKNRFVEKDIYERHLRDRHPDKYDEYIEEQASLKSEHSV